MPAEWESHEATWIAWPHNRTDWPEKFGTIPWVYGEIIRRLAPGEKVRILVNTRVQEERARRLLGRIGVSLSQIDFLRISTNRSWTRDFGPIFVRGPTARNGREIVRFRFNGWAKYPDWKRDDAVADKVARRLRCRLHQARAFGRDIVLEGGAVDVNGRGALLTTEACLLDQEHQARNPGLSREEMERVLCSFLGVTEIIWLGDGIAGDDTNGHVDDLCRFVNPGTVVLCLETDPSDPNYRVLHENRERLEGLRLQDGSRLEIVPLPLPAPLYFNRHRLPASYANFYISNSSVLVPTFNDPQDRIALGVLAELFDDRPVIGIHSVDLVWGFGTIHCMTQQQPGGIEN